MFATMQQAMRLRGFRSHSRSKWFRRSDLQQFATLTGTLLIRSYEQSERVYKAMQLRGYGSSKQNNASQFNRSHPTSQTSTPRITWHQVGLAASLAIALSFIVINFFLTATPA
jgi:cobalt/nickel transport system permease protein